MSLLGGQHELQYGTTTIRYEVTYSARRTLAIQVYPDGSVVVDAPLGSGLAEITAKVFKRAAWIVRQQRQFAEYAPKNPLPRRYVSGETYRYLGRQYRLKVQVDIVERVTLSGGYLQVFVSHPDQPARVAALLEQWYRRQAERVFAERLVRCLPLVQAVGITTTPTLKLRAMKNRWGSCTTHGTISLNPKLIQVAKDLIDYVLLHELCHLKEHHHGPAFYALLTRVLPDWQAQRRKLNQVEIL